MTVLLLASLAIAMPVSCQSAGEMAGYYLPRSSGGPAVVIVEPWCDDVETGSPVGALLLGHELGHAYQDAHRLPFDEREADRLAWRWLPWLQRLLGGRPFVTLAGRAP